MLLLASLALADEAGTVMPPATMFRVAVQIEAGDQEGPVWAWEQVELGPCVGTLSEALREPNHRRWTWLSERDGLQVGVCGDPSGYEVRLEGPPGRTPSVSQVLLESGDGQFELRREEGRWTGDAGATVSETRTLRFDPRAEARYRAVHEELLAALDRDRPRSLFADEMDDERPVGWLLDDFDDSLWDGADWDLLFDGPNSLEFDLGGFRDWGDGCGSSWGCD